MDFLDVTILKHGKLRTVLFTKPRGPHFYLNTSSCHPSLVLYIQRTVYSIAMYMFIKIELATKH